MNSTAFRHFVCAVTSSGLLFSFSTSIRADALDNWTPSQVATNPAGFMGFRLGGVAYGNGRYVSVGGEGDIGVLETSEDGLSWTMRSTPDGSILKLYDVTFANGIFVAVGWDWFGGRNIYHSNDGINWTPHTNAIANFFGVTFGRTLFGANLFVAVGDGNLLQSSSKTNKNIYTSPDGINWTARNSGAPAGDVQGIYDVASGAGRLVAVGSGYIYVSITGVVWTRTANPNAWSRVSYCNELFIVSSGPGRNLVSKDGIAWALLTNNTASTFRRVIFADGYYVAQSDSQLFTSTDGTNWIQRGFQVPSNVTLSEITLGNHSIMAVGYSQFSSMSVPVAYVSDPLVVLGMNRGVPMQLKVSGLPGRSYRIEHRNDWSANWQPLTNFILPSSPYLLTDPEASNSVQRYYRAVLLP